MSEIAGFIVGTIRIGGDEGRLTQVGPVYRNQSEATQDCESAKPCLPDLEVLALTRIENANV